MITIRICLSTVLLTYRRFYHQLQVNKTLSTKIFISKNSEVADTDEASASSKEELIRGLNDDLTREYKAIIQYMVFSSALKSVEYGDIADQLKLHASEELAHTPEVAREIDSS